MSVAESTAPPQVEELEPPLGEQEGAQPRTVAPPIMLWAENLTVSFDGFKALDDVTLLLDRGELRCIIGPNGAGKTTLMDVITGKTRPSEGSVYLESRLLNLTQMSECQIAELGIGRKFQRPTVFQGHSVFENCELALKGAKGVFHSLFARLSKADRSRRIDEVVRRRSGLSGLRRPARRACSPTGRSSGSRSACCCLPRTRRCSSSTKARSRA